MMALDIVYLLGLSSARQRGPCMSVDLNIRNHGAVVDVTWQIASIRGEGVLRFVYQLWCGISHDLWFV